jgi:hypothetical protein
MYDFVAGPMVWISFGLFLAGIVLQSVRFFRATKKRAQQLAPSSVDVKPPEAKEGEGSARRPGIPGMLEPLVRLVSRPYDRVHGWLEASVAGTHPVMTVVTVVFHLLLFVTPIFLLAHNTMIGWGFPSFPEVLSDFLTVIVILCCGVFLFRRVFLRRVRAISSAYDYFVLLITAAPFVTGFMAYHQFFDYRTVILLHMIAGEAMLILIPFTRLGHALFFFLYRFFVGSEYSFGQGKRVW